MNNTQTDRQYWLDVAEKIARPVLAAGARGELRARMPVEHDPNSQDRDEYSHLEAVGRLLCGIAPWLELREATGDEEHLRSELATLARHTIAHGVDPDSEDYLNFERGFQPIVDAAFLAHAFLRAPTALWDELADKTRRQVIEALQKTRTRQPHYNNWLLFAGLIEAFLYRAGADWDPMRIDYALRKHDEWYLGDGHYGDGPEFHWDYYNSFVIQPMLIDTLETVAGVDPKWDSMLPAVVARARRYAAIQEHLISPEGTYPPIGRSLAYRFGAFQLLAQMALQSDLPEELRPGQVRAALTAVIRRQIEAPGTFDEKGWLQIGFCGHQPGLGERYISTGSLYLCAAGLLPLGLPADDSFWTSHDHPWTSKQIWDGEDLAADHALRSR